jgi:sec-independent protein translocase protein TatC
VAKPEEEDVINDKPMPLLEHLVELRQRLLWSMAAFMVTFFVCYYFKQAIFSFLAEPVAHILESRGGERKMIYTSLTEPFFTYLKVAMFGALFIAFPVIASQLWLFVAPGLYRSEKRAILPFLVATPVLFLLGGALAYYVVFPAAWTFFLGFESPTGGGGIPIEAQLKIGEYLDLVMKLILAFGVAFQIPVGLSLMAKVGIITSKGLASYRRYAIVGMFIVGAILAPPDPITQCLLAGSLIALYELSIIAAKIVEPKPPED